ncbi:Gmad2 immunoglobulin-like domain-containing protein [Actinotalea solisilvae]|uniref:Gmad2 immunoglobulin-like domain-containing protein n=1 Tax=Actinotalea solisilvae TaxID=2072922 RepID=UPI0018F231F0|nr:Gmad2 immunoglobulin-like domain-containing protein [Actinotalea solisilvae]
MTAARPARATGVVLALALVALPAGCATDDEPGSPTSSPSASSTPTASPEPTAEPTASATPTPTADGPVVNGPNTITSPAPGAEVTSPVTARGEGTAFEATLLYAVVDAATSDVVAEGFTMAGANGEVGPWEIVLDLAPGDYTLRVWEPDMSDGESGSGPERNLVEVSFSVV